MCSSTSFHSWGTDEAKRGDLVAFERARGGEVLLKRVVAVGDDTVAIEDGRLAVNGRPRIEPYVDQRAIDSVYFGPVKVQPGTVFVLGDDRANSIDSRSFGGVPTRDVVGHVVARVWPPRRWGTPR